MSNILGNMPPVFGSGYRGVVPAPSAADVSAQNILRADGTWGATPGGAIPSQTGNATKLLTTDGTNASWSGAVTVSGSNATIGGNLTVSGTATSSFGGDLTFPTNKGIYSAVQNGRLYLSGDSAGVGAFLTLTGSSFSNPNNIRIDANTGTISNLANTKNSTWDSNQNWAIAGNLTVSGTGSTAYADNVLAVTNGTPSAIITTTGDGRTFFGSKDGGNTVVNINKSGAKTSGNLLRLSDSSGVMTIDTDVIVSSASMLQMGGNSFGAAFQIRGAPNYSMQLMATTGNLILGSGAANPTDGGQKLQVSGTALVTGSTRLDDNLLIGATSSALNFGGKGITLYNATAPEIKLIDSYTGGASTDGSSITLSNADLVITNLESAPIILKTANTTALTLDSSQRAIFSSNIHLGSLNLSDKTFTSGIANVTGGYNSTSKAQISLVGGVGDNNVQAGSYIYSQSQGGVGGTQPKLFIGHMTYTGTSLTNDSAGITLDYQNNATFAGNVTLNGAYTSTTSAALNISGVSIPGITLQTTSGSGRNFFIGSNYSSAGILTFSGSSSAGGAATTQLLNLDATNEVVKIPLSTASTTTGSGALQVSGGAGVTGAVNVGTYYGMVDGVTAPAATSGYAKIYVDTADGDLKVIFGDGTIKTIATDT